ncbi:MAG: FHA domain-containing protein [Polyangiaceae bacterium]
MSRANDRPTLISQGPNEALEQVPSPACLLVCSRATPDRITRYTLDRSPLSIGRKAPADLVVDDVCMARRHALFWFDLSSWWVRDEQSPGGIYINAHRPSAHHRLREGDSINFGQTLAHFASRALSTSDEDLLARVTSLDPTTGLYNARYFAQRLSHRSNAQSTSAVIAIFCLEGPLSQQAEQADLMRYEAARELEVSLGAGCMLAALRDDLWAAYFPEGSREAELHHQIGPLVLSSKLSTSFGPIFLKRASGSLRHEISLNEQLDQLCRSVGSSYPSR